MTKNVERELLEYFRLIHPHVTRFEESFLTDKHLAIVMEYAAGSNLFTHVTARSAPKPQLKLNRPLAQALATCESNVAACTLHNADHHVPSVQLLRTDL